VVKFVGIREKYKILEHPAELRIRVFGKTKEALFKNAAYALANILSSKPITKTTRTNDERLKTKIQIKSPDIDSLLVDFLNEILAKSQINKAVYPEIKFLKFSDTEVESKIFGCEVGHFSEDIKAVTYQDVDIRYKIYDSRNKTKLWQTIIVFDI